MLLIHKSVAIAFTSGLMMVASPAFAQHEGHQVPAMGATGTANVSACAQNAATVTAAIDGANARVEEARQLNDPAKMRAAVADVQLTLTQMKMQLADCVALNQQSMGGMAGMDHSKMQMAPGAPTLQSGSTSPAPAAPSASNANMPGMQHGNMPTTGNTPAGSEQKSTGDTTNGLQIVLKPDPTSRQAGDNIFEVTVKDKNGKPISDATVSLAFYMPPMPSMNMPAMRNALKLTSAGNGVYRGEGTIGMPGDWEVTIAVARGQQRLGSKRVKLTAR